MESLCGNDEQAEASEEPGEDKPHRTVTGKCQRTINISCTALRAGGVIHTLETALTRQTD